MYIAEIHLKNLYFEARVQRRQERISLYNVFSLIDK